MPKIEISRDAEKAQKRLPAKHRRQIAEKILSLARDPFPPDSALLKGYDLRRTDVGEYRLIYRLEVDVLRIFVIGKRNDNEVYKKLRRLR